MLINTKGSILESLLLWRGLEFCNETFHFDCGINLSRCGIERAGCYGQLWLGPLSQDLFSARVILLEFPNLGCCYAPTRSKMLTWPGTTVGGPPTQVQG